MLLGLSMVWQAACGDNLPATIHVVAEGARWMAVRPAPDAAWQRFDGDDVRFEAHGVFDVAVVCREDIGDGFTIRATAGDGLRYDDALCRRRGGITPQFAITGRADAIFVGYSASYLPNIVGQDIEAGTYDVVAQQLSTDQPQRTERIQVLRDVVIDGTAPIPIDIDQLGLPPAPATVTVDGASPDYAYMTGMTANGTWFTFFSRGVVVLPVELTRPSDRQVATLYRGNSWAEVPVRAGDNDLVLPPDTVDASFSHAMPPSVTWSSPTAWDRVTFQTAQWTTGGPGLPRWRIIAYAGAFESSTVDLPVPDLAGWQARWMTDVAGPHLLYASWEQTRADGGRGGVTRSEQR